jgi:hypothetical protein
MRLTKAKKFGNGWSNAFWVAVAARLRMAVAKGCRLTVVARFGFLICIFFFELWSDIVGDAQQDDVMKSLKYMVEFGETGQERSFIGQRQKAEHLIWKEGWSPGDDEKGTRQENRLDAWVWLRYLAKWHTEEFLSDGEEGEWTTCWVCAVMVESE